MTADHFEAHRLFVSCPRYLEGLLREEIAGLAACGEVSETVGGVFLNADLQTAYRVCLWSRLAGRVLLECAAGVVYDRDELYRLAYAVEWQHRFTVDRSFAVSGHAVHPAFPQADFAALVVKDALVDQFRERGGVRPSVDTRNPAVRVHLYLTESKALIYFDLSGESLHMRGYRRSRTEAPLRENTAAAVLVRAGWAAAVAEWREGRAPAPILADPLCGSGTLAIEAAMMATDTAPGLRRAGFGFERMRDYNEELWIPLRAAAEQRARAGRELWAASGGRIWASDRAAQAITAARENAARAEMSELITFGTSEFSRLSRGAVLGSWNKVYGSSDAFPGFVVTNPPYGVRLSERPAAEAVHPELGAWLARTLSGTQAAGLAESKEQARTIGLRAEKVYTLYNGNLKVVLALLSLNETNVYRPPAPSPGARAAAVQMQHGGDATQGVAMVVQRLKKNERGLRKYLKRERVSCYRLYDADIPQYAAAVDVYNALDQRRFAVVQEYAPPATVDPVAAEKRFAELTTGVREFLGLSSAAVYTKQRRRRRGGQQYDPRRGLQRTCPGDAYPQRTGGKRTGTADNQRWVVVEENGLLFEVNLLDYIDTGLFFDHRILRRWVRERSNGARVLNLFAYTCSFSVYAAAGGACETVSVDSSKTYLEWGRRNFRHNRIELKRHRFAREDCRDYLRHDRGRYDLIVIDAPTFSNSTGRNNELDLQRDHEQLIRAALRRLAGGGTIVFASNLRNFSLSAPLREDCAVTDISDETIPPDFARRRRRRHVYAIRDGA